MLKYIAINELDPSKNFVVSGETYEEILENALQELGYNLFYNWSENEEAKED